MISEASLKQRDQIPLQNDGRLRWIGNSLAGNFAAFPFTSLAAFASALNYTTAATAAASASNATRSTTGASFLLDATSVSLDACYLRQELFTLVCQYRPGKALRRQPFYGILSIGLFNKSMYCIHHVC